MPALFRLDAALHNEKVALLNEKAAIWNEKAALRNEKVSIYMKMTALWNEKAALKELEPKVVHYLNEDGDFVAREITRFSFNTWLASMSSLVAVTPDLDVDASIACFTTFDSVDENTVYRLEHHPVDVKACIQHLVDVKKLEFGKACESIVLVDFPGFEVVTTAEQFRANRLPANLGSKVEVDFLRDKGRRGCDRRHVSADTADPAEARSLLYGLRRAAAAADQVFLWCHAGELRNPPDLSDAVPRRACLVWKCISPAVEATEFFFCHLHFVTQKSPAAQRSEHQRSQSDPKHACEPHFGYFSFFFPFSS